MDSDAISDAGGDEAGTQARPVRGKESWGETLRFFLILFVCAMVLRSFIVAPFNIPSGSMLPNLRIGDYLFVAKWPYGFSRYSVPFGLLDFRGRVLSSLPERGDIVVFRYPGGGDEDLVKRVIGLPGDTIEVRHGVVILNGRALPRERRADFAMPITPNSPCRVVDGAVPHETPDGRTCLYQRWRETLPGGRSYDTLNELDDGDTDNFGPITVPADHLFVMGDNRDDSSDSRVPIAFHGVGLLPMDDVIGRAEIAFWSTDGSAEWVKPWTWFTAARWERLGHLYE
jgi:signal peptidase I